MSSKFAVITNLHIYGEISNPSTADGSLTYDLTMADLNYLLIPDIKIGTINNFISITYLHRSYRTTSVYFSTVVFKPSCLALSCDFNALSMARVT